MEKERNYYALLASELKNNILSSVELESGGTKHILPSEIVREILSDKGSVLYLPIFAQAFAHKTYDFDTNYEKLEITGDLKCNSITADLIKSNYPGMNEAQLSNMLSYYKSNRQFATFIGQRIQNYSQLIRIREGYPITEKILGDVFEALVEATFDVTSNTNKGIGYACAQNMYRSLSQGFVPDKRFAAGHPKTLIIQIFGNKNVREYPPEGVYKNQLTVAITDEAVGKVATDMNLKLNVKNVARETVVGEPDRKKAMWKAYENLLEKFAQQKLTVEGFEENKRKNTIKNYERGNEVLEREINLKETVRFVKTNRASQEGMVEWDLVGVSKKTGKRRLITSITGSKDTTKFHKIKDQLLEKYLDILTVIKISQESVSQYREFLASELKNNILSPITLKGGETRHILPPDIIREILSEKGKALYLPIFAQAFTHKTFDYENSYNPLEIIGDLKCNSITADLIKSHYPEINEAQLSNMLSYYKSNRQFTTFIGQRIKNYSQLIRIREDESITENILGDVFEALVEATFDVTNRIKNGIGYGCAQNMYRSLSQGFIPDKKYAAGHPKTLIIQIFGNKNVKEFPPEGTYNNQLTVTIADEAINKIAANMDLELDVNRETVSGEPDRKKATWKVYENLIEKFAKQGLTVESFEENKRKKTIEHYKRGREVLAREKKLNETVRFTKTNKASQEGMVEWDLVGVSKKTGKRRLITSITSEDTTKFHEIKDQLLEKYLEE